MSGVAASRPDTHRLLSARTEALVTRPRLGTGNDRLLAVCAQFITGYHDLDLRDVSDPGHARLPWGGPTPPNNAPLELIAIALTERSGGSTFQPKQTVLDVRHNPPLLRGEKVHISRLREAGHAIVSARLLDGSPSGSPTLALVLLDLRSPGIVLTQRQGRGLSGWSWCTVQFESVLVPSEAVLASGTRARSMLENHFAIYRLLVSALCLGAAAKVIDLAIAGAAARKRSSFSSHQLTYHVARNYGTLLLLLEGLLGLSLERHRDGWIVPAVMKPVAVEAAREIVRSLVPYFGADSYESDHPIAKISADLDGYAFADGAHEALLMRAGTFLTSCEPKPERSRTESL